MFENLETDVKALISDYREGRFIPGDSELEKHLKADLDSVEMEGGNIKWSTCSELLRSVANSLGEMSREKLKPARSTGSVDLKSFNIELFARMNDAFSILTDRPATSFQNITDFYSEFQRPKYGNDRLKIFSRKINNLFKFYCENALDKDVEIPRYSGSFILSGPRFHPATFQSVTSMALYADSIFIPDPVLPWLERRRIEESEPIATMFEILFNVLQLSPLIDEGIPGTPVALFPTWSKTREIFSITEQWEMNQSVTQFFSYYLDCEFKNIEEVSEFGRIESQHFRAKIKEHNLFQPFGGTGDIIDLHLDEALTLQKEYYGENRSPEYAKRLARLSDEEIIILGIRERLAPVHTLLSQCAEHGGQPMNWLPAQWYFLERYVEGLGGRDYDNETVSTLEALADPTLKWLSNIPIEDLARLRRKGSNVEFRQKLSEAIDLLEESSRSSPKDCAQQISRTLHQLITEHQVEVEKIEETYHHKHKQTAVLGWTGAAALFLPATLPLATSIAPISLV